MKNYSFNTREELVEFLDNHNFKYYIPRVSEYMSAIKDELKHYCVELSDCLLYTSPSPRDHG